MRKVLEAMVILGGALLFHSPSFGQTAERENPDFNLDGRVDDRDLLSLEERLGSRFGGSDYHPFFDLNGDNAIDDEDLYLFQYGWKDHADTPAPITADEFRARTGLSDLAGKTWFLECVPGGTEECDGKIRTLTGGEIVQMNGRSVLPLTWGSETLEPWVTLYLTMDGNLQFMGVEKVNEDDFHGITLPAQTLTAGEIPWTTSDMVYPGSAIESEGNIDLSISGPGIPLKGPVLEVGCLIVFVLAYGVESLRYFEAIRAIRAGIDNIYSVKLGDLNGDSHLDLVVAGYNRRVLYYLNNGTSDPFQGVRERTLLPLEESLFPKLALADVNLDGATDIVVATHQNNLLYLNNGSGSPFLGVSPRVLSTLNSTTYSIAVGDLNGDGRPDVVFGGAGETEAFLNNGLANDPFGDVIGIPVGAGTEAAFVAVADLNGDGDNDVYMGRTRADDRIRFSDGSENFPTSGVEVTVPERVAANVRGLADFNGDGFLDLAMSSTNAYQPFADLGGTRLLFNRGVTEATNPFQGATAMRVSGDDDLTVALGFADLNGDNIPDMIVANREKNDYDFARPDNDTSRYYLSNGNPSAPFDGVQGETLTLNRTRTRTVDVGDVDGDGDADVVLGGYRGWNLLFNNGVPGTFGFGPAKAESAKGDVGGSDVFLVSGTGLMDIGAGVEANAEWDLWFDADGLLFCRLCWDFMEVRKCLTYGRAGEGLLFAEAGSDCEIEAEDIGDFTNFQYAELEVESCFQGSIDGSDDTMDGFRVGTDTPFSRTLRIVASTLDDSQARLRVYRESPIRGSEILDTAIFSTPQGFDFEQQGDDYWVEVYGDGEAEYEVGATVVTDP